MCISMSYLETCAWPKLGRQILGDFGGTKMAITSSVWYKTKFGSQNFGYQLWCHFCNICNVFKNMFNVPLMIM